MTICECGINKATVESYRCQHHYDQTVCVGERCVECGDVLYLPCEDSRRILEIGVS
jgi:hypothetical protein